MYCVVRIQVVGSRQESILILINNRMIIGTFPYEQLRAIFQAPVDEAEGDRRFMESWVE